MKFLNARLLFPIFMLGIMLYSAGVSAAPGYINPKPLAEVLKNTSVKPVKRGTVQLPIITWGGDIATILANGNSLKTRKDSLFGSKGLTLNMVREDVFSSQVESYLSGKSPYLRGTMGMINQAADILNKNPATKPKIIYQLTWSTGGDGLVVKPGIRSAKDLKGKTIAVQAYGPHVDYMTKILTDAGLSVADVKIRWLPDLTGTDDSPMAALYEKDVDAVFVIIPDALALTSGGSIGTGAEGSVKGAKILLSTRTANRIIADVYAVRSDYYQSNRKDVENFVEGLLQAQNQLDGMMRGTTSRETNQLLSSAAKILLDSSEAVADVKGLYADCKFVGTEGNNQFFNDPNYPRSMSKLSSEIQQSFIALGLIDSTHSFESVISDYGQFNVADNSGSSGGQFDQEKVASVIARKQQQGTLGEGELFSFEIFFKPNQNEFSSDLYDDSFSKVLEYASTYGGALITVEGHSDPLGYLRRKKKGAQSLELGRIKQSAKNLSLTRAISVRDSLIQYANRHNITLDTSQFAVVGHGIGKPKNGVCGNEPCAPKNEKEWRDNMRVEFRIIQIEAESSVFTPL